MESELPIAGCSGLSGCGPFAIGFSPASLVEDIVTQAQTVNFKRIIETKRRELASAIRAQTAGIAVGESEHDPIDQMQSMKLREEHATRLGQLSRTLAQVDRSLHAMSEGSYGLCAECEEPISLKRLEIIPWASYCVRCQENLESRAAEERKAA
jgi:DnaK suppressor protein